MAFLDNTGLAYFWDKIKTALAGKSDIGHTHSDYLPKSGGTLTGNLNGKYITGTWLQTTSTSNLNATPQRYPVLDANGWVYFRTREEMLADLGITEKQDKIETWGDVKGE